MGACQGLGEQKMGSQCLVVRFTSEKEFWRLVNVLITTEPYT